MPKQVRLRRGTTAEHATFTGALGEVTFDTSKNTLVAHDGATCGGFPLARESTFSINDVKTGNALWVDAVNGNDATALRGRLNKPFLTLTAAKTAAQAGDTIMVLPGTYNERNLLKNGVNWHFFTGARVLYTGAAQGGIFDDSPTGADGAVVCKITGQGEFENHGSNPVSWVYNLWYAGSDVYLEALSLLSEQRSAFRCGGGLTRGHVGSIRSSTWRALELENGASFLVVDEIVSAGEMAVGVWGGPHLLTVDRILCTGGPAVHSFGGDLELTARSIVSNAGYGLHAEVADEGCIVVVNGAKIVSMLNTSGGTAVYLDRVLDLTLKDCVLVSNVIGTPAPASIDAPSAVPVRIYGTCMANLAKGANVTFITGATRFEVDSDVR